MADISDSNHCSGLHDKAYGVLLGTAIGDALGLYWEGMSPGRQARWRGGDAHTLWSVCGRSWVSDDTEHTLMVVGALLRAQGDLEAFTRALGWAMRWWVLRLPVAMGLGTGRALVKLWLGWGVSKSGVWSAGNGPAMRVAPLGVWCAGQPEQLEAMVLASTRLTHRDPRAATGSLAVARTVAMCQADGEHPAFEQWHQQMLASQQEDSLEWGEAMEMLKIYLERAGSAREFARALLPEADQGVSGYVYHTVPMALFLFWRHGEDPERALEEAVELGGDTDTVAAILGAMLGAMHGAQGFPVRWRESLRDGVVTQEGLRQAAGAMGRRDVRAMPRFFGPMRVVRNVVFLVLVLAVGFRRLAPPY